MMKNRPGEKIKLASLDELLGVVNEESAMEIEINKIHAFKNHPFKVLDDEKMQDLIESLKLSGVLTPVLLRVDSNDEYEMISGHRRLHAAKMAGLTTIPAIVRELSDDDAVIAMVDANIQREELLPSEKAFAYKMKLDAMKRQAGRPKNNSGQNDQNLMGTVSRDVLAKQVGESSKQVQRYIRLTELIPELLDMVDSKKLTFTVGVDISYIDKEIQEWIYEYIKDTGFIKPQQITALEALDMFHLTELKDRHPASLSGGEKQRVTIAAAYCSDADIIVLDEPTSGMDGEGVLSLAKWVSTLAEKGKTIIIITHDEILCEIACDNKLVIGGKKN